MGRDIEEILEEREELKKLYNALEYKKLKYSAMAVIVLVIVLMLSMIIWMDDIPYRVMLFMRGCAGFGAAVFIVLVGILAYRVNSRHIKNRTNRKE